MRSPHLAVAFLLVGVVALIGCKEEATLPVEAGIGPTPQLPAPAPGWIPTVNIAPAKPWAGEAMPKPASGLAVTAFSTGLDHPRWLAVLPNGDVLVAESNAPRKPADGKGIKGFVMKRVMARAGAGVPSADRISLLRDADGDGRAEMRTAFIEGLRSPFGMALVGDTLYVANTDALVRFHYTAGTTRIDQPATKVTDLPGGPLNHHWTKNVIASRDGKRLYVTVGSNSNVAENGIDKEAERAAIWEVDPSTGRHRLFATGLRNPNGLDWEPTTGVLWTAVNERDEIGSDLVPDYMTSVRDGGFYGWPYSYYGQHVDVRAEPPHPDLVAAAIAPDYALGPHTASLGLAFAHGDALPPALRHGVFIGQHGSWNRRPASGYKVIFVPFVDGRPAGPPLDVLTGFLDGEENAQGRPVGVVVDARGGLLVADDVGDTVWRVSSPFASQASAAP